MMMMMMVMIYQYKWFFLVVAWCNMLIYFFLSLYSPCLFSKSKCWSEMKHSGTAPVKILLFTVLMFIFYARLNVRMWLSISINCCLHWSCALQLFLHFYQVFYVRCKNKFGMQHRRTESLGLIFTVTLLRWVVHCCPLQPGGRTATAEFPIKLTLLTLSEGWNCNIIAPLVSIRREEISSGAQSGNSCWGGDKTSNLTPTQQKQKIHLVSEQII